MKRFAITFAMLTLAFSNQTFATDAPGLIEREILAPHHNRNMQMAIWYPAKEGSTELFADNAIFEGGNVRRNALPTNGKHPIILLSHGMGGTYLSLNWLASGLAESGAIVVSVNHPNGWFGDRDPKTMFNHWTRAQDLSLALDNILADPTMKDLIDQDRIYAAGFSFGGWTALSLGGATADLQGNTAYCKAAGTRAQNCTDLEHFGFDPAHTSPNKWSASYKDSRVNAVVAIEPGLTWKMTAKNVAELDQSKLTVIGLGTGQDRQYPTDTTAQGSGFDGIVPNAKIEILAPATHFTAMPLCKENGAAILAEEKDDPVCTDPVGTDRHSVHDKIIALTKLQFGL